MPAQLDDELADRRARETRAQHRREQRQRDGRVGGEEAPEEKRRDRAELGDDHVQREDEHGEASGENRGQRPAKRRAGRDPAPGEHRHQHDGDAEPDDPLCCVDRVSGRRAGPHEERIPWLLHF